MNPVKVVQEIYVAPNELRIFNIFGQADGKNPFLHLHKRCIKIQKHVCLESNLGFATEKKILQLSYYPNEEFLFFKISYACISTTSVGAAGFVYSHP